MFGSSSKLLFHCFNCATMCNIQVLWFNFPKLFSFNGLLLATAPFYEYSAAPLNCNPIILAGNERDLINQCNLICTWVVHGNSDCIKYCCTISYSMLLKLLQESTNCFCYVMKVLQNFNDLQHFQEQRGNYWVRQKHPKNSIKILKCECN